MNDQKLRRAEIALQFLQQAIKGLKNAESTPRLDPDYDLWRAWQELNTIQEMTE